MELKNKIAVVTGATGGIGRELVKELDKEGVKLLIISKSESELQNLLKELNGKGHSYLVCDFSIQEEVVKLGDTISKEYPAIDLLANVAGVGIYKPLEELSLEDWNKSLDIGVTAPFILTKAIIASLKNAKDSLVLNIGSGAGVIPFAGRSAYSAMKFAMRGFTLSLAEEFKHSNPTFCLITLGSTLTSFGPMSFEEKKREMESGKAYFTPDWVAKKLVEIIKDDKREVEYTLYPSEYQK